MEKFQIGVIAAVKRKHAQRKTRITTSLRHREVAIRVVETGVAEAELVLPLLPAQGAQYPLVKEIYLKS